MLADHIEIVGARENNLKDVTVRVPKRQIVVFTGVSGSGKSSLVFDTIAAEAQRQLNETFTAFARNFLPSYGQPDVDSIDNLSAAIIVDQKRLGGSSRSTVGTITDINPLIRLLFSRVGKPYVGYSNAFSFNDPQGMCPECEGLGKVTALDLDAFIDRSKSLNEGAVTHPDFEVGSWYLEHATPCPAGSTPTSRSPSTRRTSGSSCSTAPARCPWSGRAARSTRRTRAWSTSSPGSTSRRTSARWPSATARSSCGT